VVDGVLDALAAGVGLGVGVFVGAATVELGVGIAVVGRRVAVSVGVADRVIVDDGDAGAVGVGMVTVEVLVAVEVGGATAGGASQNPPRKINAPPVSVPASGCPIVPPSSYAPPLLKVAPPPAITLWERSYSPPLCARATAVQNSMMTSTVRMRSSAYRIAKPMRRSTDNAAGGPDFVGERY